MTTQEMIAVITAFEQGKKIEYSYKEKNTWNSTNSPSWDFYTFDFRIEEEPEYVPYDGTQEGTLVGKVVVDKERKNSFLIIGEDKHDKHFNLMIGDIEWESYEELFKFYQFPDGQPCGMLKK